MDKSGGKLADRAGVGDPRDMRTVVYGDLLKGTFRGLWGDDWKKLLDVAGSRHFGPNEVVLHQGMPSQGIFVVADGMVRIARVESDESLTNLASLGAGEVFGEMSFLENREASASVITVIPSEIVHIDGPKAEDLIATDAALGARFYKSIALALSDRLRRTNSLV